MPDPKPFSVRLLTGLLWTEAVLAALALVLCVVVAVDAQLEANENPDSWAGLGVVIGVVGAVAAGIALLLASGLLQLARHRAAATPVAVGLVHALLVLLTLQTIRSQGTVFSVGLVVAAVAFGAAFAAPSRAWFRAEAH